MFKIEIFLVLVFAFSALVSAQYTRQDEKLAATTYTRNFDKVTTNEYLKSDNDEKVIAGLLSVSQSEDTSYVPMIVSLPVNKFARELCFTLGQLGSCRRSIEYLQKIFHQDNNDPLIRYYALVALGKIADSTYGGELISDYNSSQSKSRFNGISLAVYYLYSNGYISADKIRPILENELYYSPSRQFEAAFCLYRVGPSIEEKNILVNTLTKIVDGKLLSPVTEKPVPYLLACLRKLQYFPDDFGLIEKLMTIEDFQTQIEAVRASAYYNFHTTQELDFFLHYIDNDNKNISREAAGSIRNVNLDNGLKDYLFLKLSEKLHQDTTMERYTQGELFISYISLYPEDFDDALLKMITDKISPEYVYKICSYFPASREALNLLTENFTGQPLPEKIIILESILNFAQANADVSILLLSALSSDNPPLISIAADGLDSASINAEKDTLSKIVYTKVLKHLNDPDFIESLMSLENLSHKISDELNNKIINLLSVSDLYSVKKFIAGIKGESIRNITKNIDDFNKYWAKAFEYRKAEIITEKGSFTISLFPGYAPVTVGSFCFLAEKHFFDGIPFHRVVPGFVIQGGDPSATGWGGPGYEIISEFSPLEYNKGIVGMASAGKDTEGSQWFVMTGSYPHLNGKYTAFGEVLDGSDNVDNITQGTKILRVNLIP
jgi:peptidyl-prolyl cis-trans isomerase B (cyclophilin B)